jgi:hypothetical protein
VVAELVLELFVFAQVIAHRGNDNRGCDHGDDEALSDTSAGVENVRRALNDRK